jgi:hypothetical protein
LITSGCFLPKTHQRQLSSFWKTALRAATNTRRATFSDGRWHGVTDSTLYERVTTARAPTAWIARAPRYIDARLDLADTVLTLVLLLLSATGGATGVLFS